MDWQQSNWNDSYFYSGLELEGSLIKRYLEGYDFSDRKKERQYLRVLIRVIALRLYMGIRFLQYTGRLHRCNG